MGRVPWRKAGRDLAGCLCSVWLRELRCGGCRQAFLCVVAACFLQQLSPVQDSSETAKCTGGIALVQSQSSMPGLAPGPVASADQVSGRASGNSQPPGLPQSDFQWGLKRQGAPLQHPVVHHLPPHLISSGVCIRQTPLEGCSGEEQPGLGGSRGSPADMAGSCGCGVLSEVQVRLRRARERGRSSEARQ